MAVADFVGRGWSFPAGIDARGGIRLAGGSEEIDGAIRMILSTTPGERPMRPEFGCTLSDYVFAPLDSSTLALVEQAVRRALARWEPRIDVLDVVAEPVVPVGRIELHISYVVRSTNDHRNLVFPYYVIPHEEVRG
jgi:phage baseplate assembly protein W